MNGSVLYGTSMGFRLGIGDAFEKYIYTLLCLRSSRRDHSYALTVNLWRAIASLKKIWLSHNREGQVFFANF